MEDNNNFSAPDFSDVPGLGDTQGLENYLNNAALAANGVQPTTPAADQAQPAAQPTNPAQPAAPATNPVTGGTPAANPNAGGTITLTPEQLQAIINSREQLRNTPQVNPAQQQQAQQRNAGYSQQEQQFIARALAQGYSLEQINNFLVNQKGGQRMDPVLEKRVAQVEQYLKTQEYKAAETAFINKLSDFGNKWGLSEQDLITFGNKALENGINIAVGNVNLETVFRAIYPEQYAIRSQRMTPTSSSQIFGGTSIPEGGRANASKLEDAYVDAFLKGTMPNQYAAFNKK